MLAEVLSLLMGSVDPPLATIPTTPPGYRCTETETYKVGHFVLATQGLLGRCTFCNGNNVLAKCDLIGHFSLLLGK